jgi:hypothetical protein
MSNSFATISGALKVNDYRNNKNGAFESFTSKSGKDLRQIYNYMNEFQEIERHYFRLNDTAMVLDEKVRDTDNLNDAQNLQMSLIKLKQKSCSNDLIIELAVNIRSKNQHQLALFVKTGSFIKEYPTVLKKDHSVNVQGSITQSIRVISKDIENYVNKIDCKATAGL